MNRIQLQRQKLYEADLKRKISSAFPHAKTVEDMHLAKKGRLVTQVTGADARNWAAGRIGFVFKKTRLRCEEIFKAMLSKGFSEDIKFYPPGKLNSYDRITGGILLLIGVIFLLV